MSYDMYESRSMTRSSQKIYIPQTFLIRYFNQVFTYGTRVIDIDKAIEAEAVAGYVNPNSEAPTIDKEDFDTDTFRIPYSKEKMEIGATMLGQRSIGEDIYMEPLSPDARAQQQLGKDLTMLNKRQDRLEELQRAECLQSGIVTVRGKGVNRVVTFLSDSDHFRTITGSLAWNNRSTAKVLENLSDYVQFLRDKGFMPQEVICGSKAVRDLVYNDEIVDLLDKRNLYAGTIDPKKMTREKVAYWGYLTDPGLFIYEYVANYLDPLSRKLKPYIDPDTIVITCADMDGRRHYGSIQDVKNKRARNIIGQRFQKVWETPEPSALWLLNQTAPLNGIHNDSFMSIKVRDV